MLVACSVSDGVCDGSVTFLEKPCRGRVSNCVFYRIRNNEAAKARPSSCVTGEEEVGGEGKEGEGRMIETIKQS